MLQKKDRTRLVIDDVTELRQPQASVAKSLFQLVTQHRAYLRQWLTWVDQTQSINDCRSFLKEAIAFNRGGQRLTTLLFYKDQLVGVIALVKIDKNNHQAELGYWLAPFAQGKGLATRACRRLMDYTFKHLDIHRLEIRVAKGNERSELVPQRLGFRHEGSLRAAHFLYDQYFDVELYGILKTEWLQDEEA